ncbi:membrane protein [Kordiimonas sediminis]|uniref:Membrane protein n=1 Tax=Kordiimonas sediminis TaxID=1735581 RepID=A0A919E7Y5_9PROT|nr:DUF423 domain-containing protein [Kordiimonas sediminis]GHF22756.1 membrane protein [Kordiimonas sediminis]
MRSSYWVIVSGLNGFIATLLAALGSHGLKSRLGADGLEIYSLGTQFHLLHAVMILGAALLVRHGARAGGWAAVFFLLGILGFSVSLYYRALMGAGSLGIFHWITPLGGICLMIGWAFIAYAGLQIKTPAKAP